ncbi:hypothetical protein [Fictibacillus terranigra]|uniref:Uncharacterized protein n=1 Tax=Fictibacillus terranigra TaxID=3058424 RepID=A0ABT8EAN0_9BACL|nr:hypothetical protein [Fictibacillus sp. CENA-BCM004]MDN4074963.1 hypothetical protein [Fictibacillus sp. CENA-BCM004]
MYLGIAILILLLIIILILRIVSNWNWKLVYSTYGSEDYFKIVEKLKTEGIKFKTGTPNRGFDHNIDRFKESTQQYDIYVKIDEEYLAVKALQK